MLCTSAIFSHGTIGILSQKILETIDRCAKDTYELVSKGYVQTGTQIFDVNCFTELRKKIFVSPVCKTSTIQKEEEHHILDKTAETLHLEGGVEWIEKKWSSCILKWGESAAETKESGKTNTK